MIREMSVRGTVCQGNVFGELSAREKSVGEKSVGELSGYRPCKSEWENENSPTGQKMLLIK